MSLVTKQRSQRRFPWWPLVLLLASVYLFWVLPYQRGETKVRVEFEERSDSK